MKSTEAFDGAKKVLVGGVNSPVRACTPYPFFVDHADGAQLYDIDGAAYIDFCLGYGPLVLGHRNQHVQNAVEAQLSKGWCYGAPTEQETAFAHLITKHVPNVEKIRCVNTGTEATMAAIRLARGFTQKTKIIKVEGAFHGAHDSVLVKAGSGALTHSVPNSAGIPPAVAEHTILVPFNDLEALERACADNAGTVAAFITEPVIGNAGCIPPDDGYLAGAREIMHAHEALLIFDEVITGFRLAKGGAQEYYGVDADLVTMGKIVGGGFPVGVLGGSAEIMDTLTPNGPVYNAGTFNGHPVTMAAGIATLTALTETDAIAQLHAAGARMASAISDHLAATFPDYAVNGVGPLFQAFFTSRQVRTLADAQTADAAAFLRFCTALRGNGVFIPPSQFESWFVSTAHTNAILDTAADAVGDALRGLRGQL